MSLTGPKSNYAKTDGRLTTVNGGGGPGEDYGLGDDTSLPIDSKYITLDETNFIGT